MSHLKQAYLGKYEALAKDKIDEEEIIANSFSRLQQKRRTTLDKFRPGPDFNDWLYYYLSSLRPWKRSEWLCGGVYSYILSRHKHVRVDPKEDYTRYGNTLMVPNIQSTGEKSKRILEMR